jgi:hypothetical protein
MNCADARPHLPALLYGDLQADVAQRVQAHLASCAACREECQALQGVSRLLDTLPAPGVEVDLGRLYRTAALQQDRRLRRWRRLAVAALGAAAAVLLLAFLARVEMRFEPHQFTLRWGTPPPIPVRPQPAPSPPREEPVVVAASYVPSPELEEQLSILGELVQTLSSEAELRDDRSRKDLAAIHLQVRSLQLQIAQLRLTVEKDLSALYAAHFPAANKKGEKR